MIDPITLGGTWIDVVGDIVAHAIGSNLVVNRVRVDGALELVWATACEEPPMFHRLAVSPNGIAAIFAKGNVTGNALIVLQSGVIPIGTTHGNNPGAIYFDGESFMAEWVETPGVMATWRSSDGRVSRFPIPAPWTQTSTGILDLMPDGSPLLMDEYRIYQQPPWTFWKPNVRRGVRVGQWGIEGRPDSSRVIVGLPDGRTVFTGLLGNADDPRVSVLPNGRILVGAAFTARGASLAIIDPPYPPAEQPTPPVPPPPMPPHPRPEPSTMRLPDAAQAIVVALYRKHLDLARGDDDQRRQLTSKIAETVRFTLGPSWGWKSAGSGRPPSKDAIAQQDGAILWGYDLFNGATREPNDRPEAENITGQVFIAVPPVDHLGTSVPPTIPPTIPPTTPPSDDLRPRVAALEGGLRALSDALASLSRDVSDLRARVDALPAVDVTAAVAAEIARYEVNGSTSRASFIPHSHTVKLGLQRKP